MLKEAHKRSVEELAVALEMSEDDMEAILAERNEAYEASEN